MYLLHGRLFRYGCNTLDALSRITVVEICVTT